MEKKKKIFEILAIILIAIFCISLTPKTLQNDTFYAIKIGEHIIENQEIDMKDPFSWHENMDYTYPHWLYDVMTYLIYSIGDMTAIYISTCIFAIILGICIYKVNKKLVKNQVISFILTIGVMYMLKDYITARAQLVTYILFILEVYCIEKIIETKHKKYIVGIVVISILIANLHVAVWPFLFILFLPYIAEYLIGILEERTAKKFNREVKQGNKLLIYKKDGTKLVIITLIICLLTGFLTPIGTVPYTYLIKTMQGNTTQNINEHQPLILINSAEMISILIVLLALLIFTDTKMTLNELLMLGGLILLTFFSKRHSALFVIIGSLIANRLIYNFMNTYIVDVDTKMIDKIITRFGIFMTTSIIVILSIILIKPKIKTEYIDKNSYPVEMSNFIIGYFENKGINLSDIRIYNEYNYGSYLLFRDIPVFIDSRADLYSPEFNKDVTVFTDFINSSNISTYFEDIFEKYDITHVILYKDSKMNMIINKAKLEGYKLLKEDNKFVFYEIEK